MMSPAPGLSAAVQPSERARRLDQHDEILVAIGDRITMQVDRVAIGKRQPRKIGGAHPPSEDRAAAGRIAFLLRRRQFREGLRREGEAPRLVEAGHGMACNRHCPTAALEGVTHIDEGMPIAERQLLDQAGAHHWPIEREPRGCSAAFRGNAHG